MGVCASVATVQQCVTNVFPPEMSFMWPAREISLRGFEPTFRTAVQHLSRFFCCTSLLTNVFVVVYADLSLFVFFFFSKRNLLDCFSVHCF